MDRWQEWIFSCHLLYYLQQRIPNTSNKYLTEICSLCYNKIRKYKYNYMEVDKMKIEIWIRGCKLCETENQEAIENFEQIVRKAGYTIEEKEENEKIIKMI